MMTMYVLICLTSNSEMRLKLAISMVTISPQNFVPFSYLLKFIFTVTDT